MIQLGSTVRDKISGVKGILIGRTEFLYHSARCEVGIAEVDSNGKPNESWWCDEAQLEVIEAGDSKPFGFCGG